MRSALYPHYIIRDTVAQQRMLAGLRSELFELQSLNVGSEYPTFLYFYYLAHAYTDYTLQAQQISELQASPADK